MFCLLVFLLCNNCATALHITSAGGRGDRSKYLRSEQSSFRPQILLPFSEWRLKECMAKAFSRKDETQEKQEALVIFTEKWKDTKKTFMLTLARVGPVGAALVVAMGEAGSMSRSMDKFPTKLGPWLTLFDCIGFFLECFWDFGWACKDDYEAYQERLPGGYEAEGKKCENQEKRAEGKFVLCFGHFFTQLPNALNWVGSNTASSGSSSKNSEDPNFTPSDLKCFGYFFRFMIESALDFPQGLLGDWEGNKEQKTLQKQIADTEDPAAKVIMQAKYDEWHRNEVLYKGYPIKWASRFASFCFWFNIFLEVVANCNYWLSKEGTISEEADKDGFPSDDTMLQVNLWAGITYLFAITFNVPNHFNGRNPMCSTVCSPKVPQQSFNLWKRPEPGNLDSVSHKLYKDLCKLKPEAAAAAALGGGGSGVVAECVKVCDSARKDLRDAAIWCTKDTFEHCSEYAEASDKAREFAKTWKKGADERNAARAERGIAKFKGSVLGKAAQMRAKKAAEKAQSEAITQEATGMTLESMPALAPPKETNFQGHNTPLGKLRPRQQSPGIKRSHTSPAKL